VGAVMVRFVLSVLVAAALPAITWAQPVKPIAQPIALPSPAALPTATTHSVVPVVPVAAPVASAAPVVKLPRRIPTADFAVKPVVVGPQLSPDGTRMVGRFEIGGKTTIGIYTLVGGALTAIGIPEKLDIEWYRWAGDNRILISLSQTVPWFGDEAQATRLVVYDVTTKASKFIGGKEEGLEGDDLLYVDPAGEWVLLSFQKSIYDYPSVSRIELATNKATTVVQPRDDVWEWYADKDGVVRIGIGTTETRWTMVYRKTAAEKFRKVGTAKLDDENASYDMVRVAVGSDEGYVLSSKETGRFGLYKFNYATKTLGEAVYQNASNDITDFDTSDDGKTLRSVYFTDDRDRIVWFDPVMKKTQDKIDAAMKKTQNWVVSRSRDDNVMLVWSGSANDPGAYFVYNRTARQLAQLSEVNEAVSPSDLATTRYVRYKARDGLEIPAYLTLPAGRDPKGLPLIILPHGGPYHVRDKLDYDPEVQFLANRGYVVLQPNYRGSDGYGEAFYAKGEGQWGRQMQDDLDDGMDWLVKDGIVDAKRTCMIGGSYGGYAALWGATRNPERYRCAASFAGVSDLGRQLKYQVDFRIGRKYRKNWRKTVLGTPDFDPRSVSPLFTVDQLKVPILLVHGDADQTVPYKQSKLYADVLRKAGKTFEFYTYAKEGHGFSTSANLKDWLDRLDAFLAKHNPAG
jgi:dienelactone hydrolase